MEGAMFPVLFVCYVIGFVSCQIRLNSTISDVDINGTTVSVSELVTNSGIAVSEVKLATDSTQNVNLNLTSPEDVSVRQCPRGSSKPCVVKCCPLGESIGSSRGCEPSTLKFQVLFFGETEVFNATADTDGDYDYIFGNPCYFGRFRLEPHYDSSDEFQVLRNGSLRAPYLYPDLLTPYDYCLEVFEDSEGEEEVLPLVCFLESPPTNPPLPTQFILYSVGLLISVPFLIVTMLVYTLIPELRDLHGKTLVSHILCLTVAFICLATVQLGGETLNQKICVGVAFVIQFSFLACFFWLNALSFHTWWTLEASARLKQHSGRPSQKSWGYTLCERNEVIMPKNVERKFFIGYSVYGWCIPLAILVVSVITDLMPIIPSSYLKPNFGYNKCWFSSEDAELPYFYGPVAVTIIINIVLFMFSACRVCSRRTAPRKKPRQIFRMCFFLFCVMGINWVMEIVSWFAGGPDYIWYFTDIINTLQGVIIFLIFVLEPRVRLCVRRQWGTKLSQILCRKQPDRPDVIYYSPKEAAVRMNM